MVYILAFFFPFVYFFFWENRTLAALITLALSASVLDWPIAALWAIVACYQYRRIQKAGADVSE